jgi:hypothetical protein
MQLVINQNFIAQPFVFDRPSPNLTPKEFVRGQTIDATEQMNFARQVFWVSSDGYIIDMSKASMALNPIQTYVPAPVEEKIITPPIVVPERETGLFTIKNLVTVAIVMLLIYVFFKYVLPLMKKSISLK